MSQSEENPQPEESNSKQEMEPGTMSFRSHLEELRKRVIVSLLSVGICMLGFLFWQDAVMGVLLAPYQTSWRFNFSSWYENDFKTQDFSKLSADEQTKALYIHKLAKSELDGEEITDSDWAKANASLHWFGFPLPAGLIYTAPLQYFMVFMIAAAIFGLVLASPIVFMEMWKFIGAGLYQKERRAVLRFVPFSLGLFGSGVAFGYKIMVPMALVFLVGFANPRMATNLFTISDYFRFLFILTVALGAVFQMPLIMMGLVKFGITTPGLYTKYWRHSILTMFIVSAMLTPPDPVTQVLMAGPMILLFGFGILLSKMAHRKRIEAAEMPSGSSD